MRECAKPITVYGPNGCLECPMTGYRGRSGIYEILTMTPPHPGSAEILKVTPPPFEV